MIFILFIYTSIKIGSAIQSWQKRLAAAEEAKQQHLDSAETDQQRLATAAAEAERQRVSAAAAAIRFL